MASFESWGRFPKVNQKVISPAWISDIALEHNNYPVLSRGLGRSYGDACLNDGGTLIATHRLNRFHSFDPQSGLLSCECGVTLEDILDIAIPKGWFLPVTPGTKYVTVGGAIANDIHGKNHHREGTFGRHVVQFRLLRSDGQLLVCSSDKNANLYSATIGGLGLTGIIIDAVIQLKKVASAYIEMDSIKCRNLDEFFEISRDSDKEYEYTVSWIDCLSRGTSMGRGIFMRGNHCLDSGKIAFKRKQKLKVPFDLPGFALSTASIAAFNFLYYNKQQSRHVHSLAHYDPFFYPLDTVIDWNRIYGKRGFLQFQCVVPDDNNNQSIRTILKTIVDSGQASFLAVIKEFGTIPSPGLLSFPRKGVTLALDFPLKGQSTLDLFGRLDDIVADAGGALYPAKDATMTGPHFRQYYPAWRELASLVDRKFSSSFWRRVTCDV